MPSWTHLFPSLDASNTVVQGSCARAAGENMKIQVAHVQVGLPTLTGSTGGFQRPLTPTGGAAYGIPRNAAIVVLRVISEAPCTGPNLVFTTRDAVAAATPTVTQHK